jgi:two-component system, NtrC family, sensor kinase
MIFMIATVTSGTGPDASSAPSPGPIAWWKRLSVRFAALIAVVTLAVLGTFVFAALRVQRQYLTQEVVRSAALFSDTIKSSTYHFMLENRRDEVYRIIETIGRQAGVEGVRIFNKEGQITFSTDATETGRLVDKRAESCYACHASDQPIERLALSSRSRIYPRDGQRILGMVAPIYNEASCSRSSCHAHPESQRVLGVVDIGLSLAEVDAGMARLERRMLLISLGALLGVGALGGIIAARFVARPVSRLVKGTREVAGGRLGHEIAVTSDDEIGHLAASFNHMTRSLGQAREEIRRLMEGLERQVEERTAALQAAQNQLIQSEKMASLGKLSASIAHEVNNPLAGILTSTKLLLRTLHEGPIDERAHASFTRSLHLVERETERCTAIVRNLLDFSRQREPTLKTVDVNACLEEALSLLRNQAAIQGIVIESHLAPVPAIQADFGQLRQAVMNVLLNACEAMPRGGTLTVSTRRATDGSMLEVEVRDTGVGIAPEHLSRIFDPFFTTKEKGTGLGLSVVYGVIERHGGKLAIQSELGKGTTMLIRLPIAPGEP